MGQALSPDVLRYIKRSKCFDAVGTSNPSIEHCLDCFRRSQCFDKEGKRTNKHPEGNKRG